MEVKQCHECKKALSLVEKHKCSYCKQEYCMDHRLPEDHNCKILNELKKRNHEKWKEAMKKPHIDHWKPKVKGGFDVGFYDDLNDYHIKREYSNREKIKNFLKYGSIVLIITIVLSLAVHYIK